MLEIRIHGRGGQGAVLASYLIGKSAFYNGYYVQAFPTYGVERRGAPVTAFCRISEEPIKIHYFVYNPNHLIFLDEGLYNNEKAEIVLINTTKQIGTHQIDATSIALKILGKPIVNTAMVAYYGKITNLYKKEHLIEAMKDYFKGEILEKNVKIVEEVFKM
jgi:pyruvate ferredoxin oxidoreductase gamma subunit